ncbi:MAG: hypothetical protein KAR21_13600 [Spirochaetales bacterium]|nr:hypothetical protein [Spirochaetales bacterium]
MKISKKAQEILIQISEITNMERGKVCKLKGRKGFNHQTWYKGRNIVKYIHSEDLLDIELAIKEYNRFMILVQKYADEIIKQSRNERKIKSKKRKMK